MLSNTGQRNRSGSYGSQGGVDGRTNSIQERRLSTKMGRCSIRGGYGNYPLCPDAAPVAARWGSISSAVRGGMIARYVPLIRAGTCRARLFTPFPTVVHPVSSLHGRWRAWCAMRGV